jgi:hypothetical protein
MVVKSCEIINGRFSYVMKVDGKTIPFNGSDCAEYFKRHYAALGYVVIETGDGE